jgi:Uma2 family endonuclease
MTSLQVVDAAVYAKLNSLACDKPARIGDNPCPPPAATASCRWRRTTPLAARSHMTPEEYVAFAAASPVRHEYVRGEVFAMSGTSGWHNEIAFNACAQLKAQAVPRGCRAYITDVKLRVERANSYFYPDVVVTCDERDQPSGHVMRHANVVVEVLSESTAEYDRGAKFADYRKPDSLQADVLVETAYRIVHVYERQESRFWRYASYGRGEVARIDVMDLKLPVDDLYVGTAVPADPPPSRSDPERGAQA